MELLELEMRAKAIKSLLNKPEPEDEGIFYLICILVQIVKTWPFLQEKEKMKRRIVRLRRRQGQLNLMEYLSTGFC